MMLVPYKSSSSQGICRECHDVARECGRDGNGQCRSQSLVSAGYVIDTTVGYFVRSTLYSRSGISHCLRLYNRDPVILLYTLRSRPPSIRDHPRRLQTRLAQRRFPKGERPIIRSVALVLPDPRDGIMAGHVTLPKGFLLQGELGGRDPTGGLVTGVYGHSGSTLFGGGTPVGGTGVPEDDVPRAEVRVDDLGPVSFEPVDVLGRVFEVVPPDAFLPGGGTARRVKPSASGARFGYVRKLCGTHILQSERLDQLGEQLGRTLHHPQSTVLFRVRQLEPNESKRRAV